MREITRDTTARPLGRHSVFGEIRSRAYNIICILRRGYRRGSASVRSKVKIICLSARELREDIEKSQKKVGEIFGGRG